MLVMVQSLEFSSNDIVLFSALGFFRNKYRSGSPSRYIFNSSIPVSIAFFAASRNSSGSVNP